MACLFLPPVGAEARSDKRLAAGHPTGSGGGGGGSGCSGQPRGAATAAIATDDPAA